MPVDLRVRMCCMLGCFVVLCGQQHPLLLTACVCWLWHHHRHVSAAWPGVVGAKAYNLALLRSTLPEWVRVPSSVALPFGVFEAVMAANPGPAAQLQQLQAELSRAQVGRHGWLECWRAGMFSVDKASLV